MFETPSNGTVNLRWNASLLKVFINLKLSDKIQVAKEQDEFFEITCVFLH